MKFAFREVPDPGGATVRARPIVDVVVGGLDLAPHACLIDSGATAVRFGTHVAEMCGIDLSGTPEATIAVGGSTVTGHMSEASLLIVDDVHESYEWTAPVWFCEPWRPAFGLLGLTGFFDHFEVTIASYEERIELTPISS